MTAFDTAEGSVQDSEPREYFSISINGGVTIYRHTSGSRDLTIGGQVFTAIAMQRGELTVTMPGEEAEMTLALPIDHPYVRRYTQESTPPQQTTVTVYRLNGGVSEQIFVGDITSMNVDRGVARFRVPSRAGDWMLRVIPVSTVSRTCPHILFSTPCGVSRTGAGPLGLAFKRTTTILAVDGRDIKVDLDDSNRIGTEWAVDGEVYHSLTGERETVRVQTDISPGSSTLTWLTLHSVIVGLKVGDSVDIFAGCSHDIQTCNDKFGNRHAHGGFPQLPDVNPFIPTGTGSEGL